MAVQLPLNLQLRDDATLASFFPADNIEVFEAVTQMVEGLGEPFLYVWGKAGSGRTHLLQAACQAAGEKDISAVYLPLQGSKNLSSDIFQGVEDVPLVCIDDIESLAGLSFLEEGLFHLFNRIRLKNGRLLVASNTPPKHLKIHLEDLKSRLASGVVYQLHCLTDEQKIMALQLRAECRGLHLTKTVGQFLLHRCARTMSELFQTLEILDRASLAEQRRLTIPFVKQVLDI